ncbi:MAG: hypothetical protein LBS59_03880 [Puniceicoccales bacterium]|jgi:hypothetical protein|nr:hypothetical protein [Puniceicoccales bacterium]
MFFRYFSMFAFLAAPALPLLAANDGLVARWTFDGATGTDATGKFPATIRGTARTASGVFGDALEFTKGVPLSVKVSPTVLPEGIRELSITAWVAPITLNGTIFRKEDVGRHGENRILFALQNGKFVTFGINCGGNYAECDALIDPVELADGKWHLVAGVFDGKVMRVYLDGREIGSLARQVPLNTVHDFAPLKVNRDAIARSQYESMSSVTVRGEPVFLGSANGSNEFFEGKIDDIRFYSKALTPAQIATLHADGGQPVTFATPNPKFYQKANTFVETLAAVGRRAERDPIPAADAVGVQRLLRSDFPDETAAYISKWQKNPVDNVLLDAPARRKYADTLSTRAFEYLPLTDLQWSVLSKSERTKWERVRTIKEQLDNPSAPISSEVLFVMESLVEERPRRHEGVAAYVAPKTPETVTRTPEEARNIIEKDWLHQTYDKPTVARSLKEITYARKLAARFNLPNSEIKSLLDKLDALEIRAKQEDPNALNKSLYFDVRTVKREITFKNPILDFDSILYIDTPYPGGSEAQHETRHRLGYMGVPGGRLLIQKGFNPDGKLTQLAPSAPIHGSFWRPDLSYDASKVIFSFKPHNEKTFHIYEIGVDGKGLRQLTGGMFDDLDPVYLPDGKNFVFLTSRGHIYVRCMPPTNAFVMAKMPLDVRPGDKSLYIISRNGEPEYTPSVLSDGRVIYTRWEYTDKPLWRAQSLWTMNQNGTNVQTFWGNQSVWPDLLKDARSIPGSNRIMFTGSAHHNWFSGCIGIIDPSKGLNFPDGLTKVTQELHWPESGNGPVDPKENNTYHASGFFSGYYSPYPLSEKDFLVSAKRGRNPWRGGNFILYLMDTDGNRELINEGAHNVFDAIPLRKRPVPRVQVDTVNWPSWEERDTPGTGHIYSNNVYENAPPELKDKAKYLRIWSIEHKTYTYWYKRNYVSSGPEVSANQSEGVKKIIGTVPIEEDGSVSFNAPSGIALHFQLLDENHRALQTMKSFTGVQPGENRACFGCHEQKMNAPVSNTIGKALRRQPSSITPPPWKDISVGYERYVQPVLDKHCGGCHADEKKAAYKKFNSKLRPGFLGFKEPYMTLLGSPTWGSAYKKRTDMGGAFGWADTILVESYGTTAPAAYATYPAMTRLSYKSRLVERMANGKHNNVKVPHNELLRVIHWIDAMGPYNGTEEIRKMEDPIFQGKDWISQRPRIHTAPIVPRPGPFDVFHPDEDPAYFTPPPARYNAIPYGVKHTQSSQVTSAN